MRVYRDGMKTEFDADELNLIKLAREYSDEDRARELLETLRWPDGAKCPHCGEAEPYKLQPKATSKRPGRKGLYKCRKCRKQFTVTVGTIFEDSHIPISTWLQAIFILCSSKKSVSAHQLHRMLGITYKSAWFMAHRLRYAMEPEMPLGKLMSGIVEYDETFVGGKPRNGEKNDPRTRRERKIPVMALVQRGGELATRVVSNVTVNNISQFVGPNVAAGTIVCSDQAGATHTAVLMRHQQRLPHRVVNHSVKEYARREADGTVTHVNTCESFFSLLKRGVYGAWHHVSKEHLPKYSAEFAFRWNHRGKTDGARMAEAIKTTEGKRLSYKPLTGA